MAERKFRDVESLAASVAADPVLQQKLRDNPVDTLQNLAGTPLQTDPLIYRIIVASLGSAILLTILAAAILAGFNRSLPEGAIAIGSAAGGALAGLLIPPMARQ